MDIPNKPWRTSACGSLADVQQMLCPTLVTGEHTPTFEIGKEQQGVGYKREVTLT